MTVRATCPTPKIFRGWAEFGRPARVPELVPSRYGQMAVSPFAFYRGATAVMAADLADPGSDLFVTKLNGVDLPG